MIIPMRFVGDSGSLRRAMGVSVLVATAWLLPQPAKAVLVIVGGTSYDVLVTNRSHEQEPTLFTVAKMPWFSGNIADPNLAYEFAQLVNGYLGSNSYPGFAAMGGPLFAFATNATDVYAVFQEIGNPNVQNEIQVGRNQVYNYAYAMPSSPPPPTPVPAPLPVAAAAMAFGWSRQLRSRQRRPGSGGSLTPSGSSGSGRKLGS